MIAEDRLYTAEHEWLLKLPDEVTYRVGITHFAQDSLGDVVHVSLPEPGAEVTAGEPLGEIESTKTWSEIYAPVTGVVAARNDSLTGSPDLINSDPYGAGWLVEITISAAGTEPAANLLDPDAYRLLTEGS